MFWALLISGYMAVAMTSVTATSNSILDTDLQGGPYQGDNEGIESWHSDPSKGNAEDKDLQLEERNLGVLDLIAKNVLKQYNKWYNETTTESAWPIRMPLRYGRRR